MDDQTTLFSVTTLNYLPSYVSTSKNSRKFEIFPKNDDMQWNFSKLSVFLNQLTNFHSIDHSFRTKKQKAKFHFKTEYPNPNLEDGEIFISILDNKIVVKAKLSYLAVEWFAFHSILNSNIGSQNKSKKTYSDQIHVRFWKSFALSSSSQALFYHRSLLFFHDVDFSNVFNYFVNHFKKFEFCKINDKQQIEFLLIKLRCK